MLLGGISSLTRSRETGRINQTSATWREVIGDDPSSMYQVATTNPSNDKIS